MDVERVNALLSTARIGRPLIWLATTGSTMTDVRERADAGAAEGLVVAADEQTAGRGRLGRTWVAPAGVNLSLSVLLRPSTEAMKRLSIVAPLAVHDAVRDVTGLEPVFK